MKSSRRIVGSSILQAGGLVLAPAVDVLHSGRGRGWGGAGVAAAGVGPVRAEEPLQLTDVQARAHQVVAAAPATRVTIRDSNEGSRRRFLVSIDSNPFAGGGVGLSHLIGSFSLLNSFLRNLRLL